MTEKTIKTIQVPQDMQFVDANGRINAVWHRYLMRMTGMVDPHNAVAEELAVAQSGIGDASLRLAKLEEHFKRTTVEQLEDLALTVTDPPTFTEVKAIADAVNTLHAKVQEIIDALYTATILGD